LENRFRTCCNPSRKVNKLEFITKKKIKLHQNNINDALVLKRKNYTPKKDYLLVYTLGNSDEDVTVIIYGKKKTKP
jgi:hypothetical protein